MPLLKILTDPQDFKFYAGGKGYVSTSNNFGQKSIPYDNDRPGGGNSGQPYIQTPINGESGTSTSGNTDFLLRGGIQAPSRAVDDVARLTKYMFSTKSPSGLLFIAKQNLLSRVSPKTEASKGPGYAGGSLYAGVYTPLSTLAQAGVGYLGSHLNKQGLSPFDGSPLSINKYEDVVKANNEPGVNILSQTNGQFSNRLLNVWYNKQFQIQTTQTLTQDPFPVTSKLGTTPSFIPSEPTPTYSSYIDVYDGGPGSVLGIGKTRIRFADQRTGNQNSNLRTSGFFSTLNDFGYYDYGVFKPVRSILYKGASIFNGKTVSSKYEDITGDNLLEDYSTINDSPELQNFLISSTKSGSLYETSKLNTKSLEKANQKTYGGNLFDTGSLSPNGQPTYLASLNNKYPKPNDAINNAYDIERRLALGDPGRVKGTYAKHIIKKDQVLDKINASPIYTRTSGSIGRNSKDYNDLVSFRIGIIDPTSPNTTRYMNFRAYINSFSDSYSATWKGQRYMGRAEEFYKYDGFGRDISLAFTVVAHSQGEMHGMYQKLNFLASSLAPTYTTSGYMAGNLAKLTFGDYIYEQPGFISSITYDIPEESSWDLSLTPEGRIANKNNPDELPFMIKVTGFKFTPIHTFRPEIQSENLANPNRFITNDLEFNPSWHKGDEGFKNK
jgi:hypothetical protein